MVESPGNGSAPIIRLGRGQGQGEGLLIDLDVEVAGRRVIIDRRFLKAR
jgi:hypothetical protein